MILYLDPSAWIKYWIEEEGSPEVRNAMADPSFVTIACSRLGRVDLASALHLNSGSESVLVLTFDQEMRDEFRAAVEHTQIDPEGLVVMRPWYAAEELEGAMSGKLTMHTEEGVDKRIYAMAEARGVHDVRALETPELSLQALKRDATTKNELALLRVAMKKAATKPMLAGKKMLEAWEAGDTATILAMEAASQPPEQFKAVLEKAAKRFAALAKVEERHAGHYQKALDALQA